MQFKKNIILVLAFFILISNSGLAFNVHYCGEKIAAISSVFSNDEVCDVNNSNDASKEPINKDESCCAKKEVTHKKCCSDKELNLKDTSEKFSFKTISFDLDLFVYSITTRSVFFSLDETSVTSNAIAYYCDANAPPLYQLYCQYTLYA